MKRVPDLIDVWFDSGAMPYAQWHFPFGEIKEGNPSSGKARRLSRLILLPKVLTRQEAGFIHFMLLLLCCLIVWLTKPVCQTDWCWIRTATK